MESGLLMDIVIPESMTILKFLSIPNQVLFVWMNALLFLNLGLHALDAVWGFDIESESLAGVGLDEDLHTTFETEDQVEGRFSLNFVVNES